MLLKEKSKSFVKSLITITIFNISLLSCATVDVQESTELSYIEIPNKTNQIEAWIGSYEYEPDIYWDEYDDPIEADTGRFKVFNRRTIMINPLKINEQVVLGTMIPMCHLGALSYIIPPRYKVILIPKTSYPHFNRVGGQNTNCLTT